MMTDRSRALRIAAGAIALCSAVFVASCGGGSSSSTPAPIASATATATATGSTATAAPTSVATTGVLGATITMPTVAGYSVALTFSPPPSPSGVSATLVGYNYAPINVPTNAPSSQPSPSSGASPTVIAAWTFALAQTVTISTGPSQTYTGISTPPAGKSYYTYFADITANVSQGYSGPLTYANGSATIVGSSNGGNNLALTGGDTYVIELVAF